MALKSECEGCRICWVCYYRGTEYTETCPCSTCIVKVICQDHLICKIRDNWAWKGELRLLKLKILRK